MLVVSREAQLFRSIQLKLLLFMVLIPPFHTGLGMLVMNSLSFKVLLWENLGIYSLAVIIIAPHQVKNSFHSCKCQGPVAFPGLWIIMPFLLIQMQF